MKQKHKWPVQASDNFRLATCRLISEQQRVYGRGERAYETDEKENGAAAKANKDMKNMDKVSHVFRLGDYNDIGKKMRFDVGYSYQALVVCSDGHGRCKIHLEDHESVDVQIWQQLYIILCM